MAGNVLEHLIPARANFRATHLITAWSPEVFGPEIVAVAPALATNITAGQNGISLMPLTLRGPFTINQFFWFNGSGTSAGNSIMGVYNEAGTAILANSGLTANGATSTIQTVDITDVTLPPGRYWVALGTDSTTHQYQRLTLTAPYADYLGMKGMAAGISAGALVTPLVFAVGSNTVWLSGLVGASVM